MKYFLTTFLILCLMPPSLSKAGNLADEALELNKKFAEVYQKGRYDEAMSYAKKALEITEKAFGKDHPNVAKSIGNLAEIYRVTGRYAEAEPLFRRSLEIREKLLGRDHPDVATALNNLGLLYLVTGRYSDAEPLFKRSLAIREKALGKDHPDVATSLSNLGAIYNATGRYAEAEPLFKSSLEIREKVLGKDHPDVATSLNNLAAIYSATSRYSEAEPLLKKNLKINERFLGKDHPNIAATLNNLATLYDSAGRYAEAEPLYKRSVEIVEKSFGEDHPNLATSLNSLAILYKDTNRYSEAEPLFRRALEIREKAFGKDHPHIGTTLINLAFMYASIDRHPEGHELFKRSMFIVDKAREDIFLILNDRQKLSYMNQREISMHAFVTHTTRYLQSKAAAVADTFNAWLRWKGAVMEAQGKYLNAIYTSDIPEIRNKFSELVAIRRELARLQLSKPQGMTFHDYKITLDGLTKKKEDLEAELTNLSSDFALEKQTVKADLKKVSQILPSNSLYIDYAKINFYDFSNMEWENPKYIAFVLVPKKIPEVRLLNLGDAEEIDRHIRKYREEINKVKEYGIPPDTGILNKEARVLYDLVMKPVEPFMKEKKQLLISPDGNLNLIPFEVLIGPKGRYLMEDYPIDYVAAGRDIIRFTDPATAKGDALILADPDYDMGLKEKEKTAKELRTAKAVRGIVSRDASSLNFPPLPDTKDEADAIAKTLRDKIRLKVRNYQDKKALEEVLFSADKLKVLHLATHGYFLKDEELRGENLRGAAIKFKEDYDSDISVNIENPMLRSGIVLAGVNASLKEGRDDGMVTAEKILGLRLKGTDLVVLSACETGVGDIENGEGVFGLKRAFILSGAKTVVMSLWSVPSKETTDLMIKFYSFLAQKKTKAEALRQAKLGIMKKNKNPFFWGAFVLVGKPD